MGDMLNLFRNLSSALLFEATSWDPASANAMPVRASSPEMLPDEPSTLVLAMIGIGIMGVYVSLKRWRRPQELSAGTSDTPRSRNRVTPEHPKRGAA
jgi:hypothetical protein